MSASGIMAGTTMDIRIGTQAITAIAEGSTAIGITATAAGIIIEEATTPLPGSAKTCASSSRSWSALAAVHLARRLAPGWRDGETSPGTGWIFQRPDRTAWQTSAAKRGKAGRILTSELNSPSRFTRRRRRERSHLFYFILHLLYDVMDIHFSAGSFRGCE